MTDINLTQDAYIYIHDQLETGKMAPGARLSHRKVAKEMGFTDSPVRGAIARLIHEGRLDHHPGLGAFVPAPNQREIEEVYELRIILECAAVAKVCENLNEKTFIEMQRCIDRQDAILAKIDNTAEFAWRVELMGEWSEVDNEFHIVLLRSASNRKILNTMDELWRRFRVVRHRLSEENIGSVSRKSLDEHKRIIAALRQGDAELASQVLTEHIQTGCELALRVHEDYYMELPS